MKRNFVIQSLRKFGGQEASSTALNRIPEDSASYALNLMWTKTGTIRRRNGFKYAGRSGVIMPSETYRVLGKYTRPDGTTHLAVASASRLYDIDLAAGFATEIMNGGASIANCFAFASWKGYGYYVMQNVPGASNRVILVGDTGAVTIGATTGTIVGASQAVVWKDRIWKINTNGTTPEDNYVRYSGILASTFGVNDFVNVAGQNDGYVTAIAVYNDLLYIFKNNAIYALSADGDAATWQLRLVHSNLGCVGTNTVMVVDGMLYFYSQDGMYRTDGTNFQELSENIRHDLRYTYTFPVRTRVMNNWAVFIDRHIILYLGVAKGAWVYSLDHEAWGYWSWNEMYLDLYGAAVVNEYAVPELHVGVQDGTGRHLFMPFSSTASGGAVWKDVAAAPFVCQWISGALDSGQPAEMKRHMYTEIEYLYSGTPEITVISAGDEINSYAGRNITTPGSYTPSLRSPLPNVARAPAVNRHRLLQFTVTHSSDTLFELVGLHWAIMQKDHVGKNYGNQS